MANIFTNPIILDDFSVDIDVGYSMFGISDIPLYIQHIEWRTPTTIDNTAVITDGSGKSIFDEKCTVPNLSIFKPFGGNIVMGIKVASGAVTSGKIEIKLQ
jgi:hypothetical protein